MRIMHVALGGCLKAPPVAYGITEDTGGHIAYVLGAAQAQAQLPGVTVEIVTRRFDAPELGAAHARPVETVRPGLTIRRLSTERPGYLCKDALTAELGSVTEALLAHLESAERPDVIHAHFADAAEVAFAARARHGIPVIFTAHSLALDKSAACGAHGPSLRARIARETRAVARADAVIASSRDEAERQLAAYEGARPGRIHKIPPGVDPMPATPDTGSAARLLAPFLREPERPLVLAIARPVRKKNLPALIDVFAETPGLAERANLAVVAGLRDGVDEGPEETREVHRALLAAVDRHGLWGRVALPRRHAPADVPALYALAARGHGVFVNPALTEPFGLTLLEAARAGLPVVATCHGGPADIVEAIGHGAVADPADRAAFGGAILRLLSDPVAWAAASANALARTPMLDWGRYARAHLAVCRSLVAPRRVPDGSRGMLCTDIDATLTGSRPAAARFRTWAERRERVLVAATGRSITQARAIMGDWGLPEPDAWITSVGSEIYLRGADGQPEADADWAARIAQGWRPDALRDVLARLPGVAPQREIEFRPFKLSYVAATPGRAEAARAAIAAAGLEANLILSHGDLLDVLPARAGKASAMAWVARRLGVPPARIAAAGDSGNDLDMLAAAAFGIVVGRSPELAPLHGRRGIHLAEAAHADGVLEGLAELDLRALVAAP